MEFLNTLFLSVVCVVVYNAFKYWSRIFRVYKYTADLPYAKGHFLLGNALELASSQGKLNIYYK